MHTKNTGHGSQEENSYKQKNKQILEDKRVKKVRMIIEKKDLYDNRNS
jgi:hypothetical protein